MALRLLLIAPSACFTDHLPHGDGLVAAGFVRELARRGHELHVAAGRVALQEELPKNVHLYPFGAVGRLRYMYAIRQLARRLGDFDVVHQLNPVEVGVSLALVGDETPLVLGPYIPSWAPSGPGADAQVGSLARRVKRVLREAQQRRAATVLLTTRAAASEVEGRGSSARVEQLPHGIDADVWRPPANPTMGQTVLFLANLEVRKGIHVLLDAFEGVAGRLPEARLRVAGDGPERAAVERRVRESPRLARVELLGHLDRDGALAAMQACDVYCLPSYGEPFGMTALEAMACARPLVVTAAGGLQHLVPEDGGSKVPVGDPVALADALVTLLDDAGLRQSMGAANRATVEERFAWRRVGERLERLYDEAIRGRRDAEPPARDGGSRTRAPDRR